MGPTTMSLTDRHLRTSSDELPQVRSRRRWILPTAGAAVLLTGCTFAGVHLLGGAEQAPAAPQAAAGPSAQEIQAAKDAAWQSVQAWDQRTSQAAQVNSLDGIDVASVALPEAIKNRQQVIDSAVAAGVHFEGNNTLSLISSEYNAADPGAFAPARVKLSTCLDSSAVRVLDAAGNNVRVGSNGSTDFATRTVYDFWVYDTDGKWLSDAGTTAEEPC